MAMAWGLEDKTDAELKNDKEVMKIETVWWMFAWWWNGKDRWRDAEKNIAGRLNVQHVVRSSDKK